MIDFKLNSSRKNQIFDDFCKKNVLEILDKEEDMLRNQIKIEFAKITSTDLEFEKQDKYKYDVYMGSALYSVFQEQNIGFRYLSDKEFWEYLSIKIVPDLVRDRFNYDKHRYLAKHGLNRIWLYTVWCYFNLSFDVSIDNTIKMLLSKNFSTDTILNLVDRIGDGYNVNLYRKIIKEYSKISIDKNKSKYNSQYLFRFIMRLNTSHNNIIDTNNYTNGIDGYVKYIFETVGAY